MVKIRAASANRVHKRAERYCGQLQSYQYQALVQYAQVNACRSTLAARSSASSGTSNVRISASVSANSLTSLSMALASHQEKWS